MQPQSQQIDYAGLVNALILFITSLTMIINIWKQHEITEAKNRIEEVKAQVVEVKTVVHEINGNIQMQLDDKVDKPPDKGG